MNGSVAKVKTVQIACSRLGSLHDQLLCHEISECSQLSAGSQRGTCRRPYLDLQCPKRNPTRNKGPGLI